MLRRKIAIFIAIIFTLNFSLADELMTNSKKLEEFNKETSQRNAWILSQNKKVNSRIAMSTNAQKLAKLYRTEYNIDTAIQIEPAKEGKVYKLIDRGLGRPQELVLESANTKEVIFSSFQLAKNNTYNSLSFKLNKLADKVAIAFDFKGSIDGYKLIVVDLKTKKLIFKDIISFGGASGAYFFKDEAIVVQTSKNDGSDLKAFPFDASKEPYLLYEDQSFGLSIDEWTAIAGQTENITMISENESLEIKDIGDVKFLGIKDNYFYYSKSESDDEHDRTQILKVSKNNLTKIETIIDSKNDFNDIDLLEEHLVAEINKGSIRTLVSYNLKNPNDAKEITLPDCCSINSVNESKGNVSILNVTISSELVKKKLIQWDLEKNEILNLEKVTEEMLNSSELGIVTEFRMIESFDGTLVPIKMVYKKGLDLLNVPVYMEAYGGFGIAGYLNPSFNNFNLNFVKHNGLYVGTALRGGNEFGEKWHLAANLKNKPKTYEDLASIAKYFIDQGISSKEKIIIVGSSNGGLTVAATGLLYPQYFGLVIPHNGVLDLLAKEELDPSFGHGWSYEYGDSRNADDYKYLKLISPTELTENCLKPNYCPRFLVLNGKNDTRVNTAHSIKFTMSLAAIPESKVEMISLINSGHFNSSLRYNDYIGWRIQVIKWSTIFDYLGLEY